MAIALLRMMSTQGGQIDDIRAFHRACLRTEECRGRTRCEAGEDHARQKLGQQEASLKKEAQRKAAGVPACQNVWQPAPWEAP